MRVVTAGRARTRQGSGREQVRDRRGQRLSAQLTERGSSPRLVPSSFGENPWRIGAQRMTTDPRLRMTCLRMTMNRTTRGMTDSRTESRAQADRHREQDADHGDDHAVDQVPAQAGAEHRAVLRQRKPALRQPRVGGQVGALAAEAGQHHVVDRRDDHHQPGGGEDERHHPAGAHPTASPGRRRGTAGRLGSGTDWASDRLTHAAPSCWLAMEPKPLNLTRPNAMPTPTTPSTTASTLA